MVCNCKQVSYIDIRKAMVQGSRTLDEIKAITGAGSACEKCKGLLQKIIDLKR